MVSSVESPLGIRAGKAADNENCCLLAPMLLIARLIRCYVATSSVDQMANRFHMRELVKCCGVVTCCNQRTTHESDESGPWPSNQYYNHQGCVRNLHLPSHQCPCRSISHIQSTHPQAASSFTSTNYTNITGTGTPKFCTPTDVPAVPVLAPAPAASSCSHSNSCGFRA